MTAIASQRFGNATDLYLGVPLVVILVSFAVLLRQRRTILFAGSLALIAFVLSLGPRLRVDGHETSISLPFVVFEHLPLVNGFTSIRFSLYTALFTAAMFAIGLDELWRRMMRSRRPAWPSPRWRSVATVGALAASPPSRCFRWHHATRSRRLRRMFRPFSRRRPLRPFQLGAWSWPIPTRIPQVAGTSRHDIMLDQAVAGMRFKLIGG